MTQNEMVMDYINTVGSIDPFRAFTDLGILRLGARIFDLRASGHDIVTEMKTKRYPDGTVKSWAEYKKSRSPVDQTGERQEAGSYSTSKNTTDG